LTALSVNKLADIPELYSGGKISRQTPNLCQTVSKLRNKKVPSYSVLAIHRNEQNMTRKSRGKENQTGKMSISHLPQIAVAPLPRSPANGRSHDPRDRPTGVQVSLPSTEVRGVSFPSVPGFSNASKHGVHAARTEDRQQGVRFARSPARKPYWTQPLCYITERWKVKGPSVGITAHTRLDHRVESDEVVSQSKAGLKEIQTRPTGQANNSSIPPPGPGVSRGD
jgi:hypothetical protein